MSEMLALQLGVLTALLLNPAIAWLERLIDGWRKS